MWDMGKLGWIKSFDSGFMFYELMDSDCEAPGGVADGGSSFRSHRRSRCQVISIKGLGSGLSSHSGEANRSWVCF